MPSTIKARDDHDGCGCLECRDIETVTIRRSVLDALVWSVRLLRKYPSILVFGLAIVVLNRVLETESIHIIPTPVVGGLEVLTTFTFVILLRAYVGTVIASELTDTHLTYRERFRHSLARTPALIGIVVSLVFLIMFVPFLVSIPLFVLLALIPGNPIELFGFATVAAVGGLTFALPFLFLLFKFWFAPEACVIGRYGPIESLRISWRITTNYRTKLLLVTLIAAGSAVSFVIFGAFPDAGGGVLSFSPVIAALSASVGELLSVVWAGTYAHIYVQGVVDI